MRPILRIASLLGFVAWLVLDVAWLILDEAVRASADSGPAPAVPEAPGGANYLLPISAVVILAVGAGLLLLRSRRRSGGADKPSDPGGSVVSNVFDEEPDALEGTPPPS
jgi:hypothetical protein